MIDGGVFLDGLNQFQTFPSQQPTTTTIGGSFSGLPTGNAFSVPSSNLPLALDSYSFIAAIVEKQRLDMDQHILLEMTRLRSSLHQQLKQQMVSLMSVEWNTSLLVKQKEGELAMAKQRVAELEACLKRVESERDEWKRIAKENETLALSLTAAIEQANQPCFSSTGETVNEDVEEKVESCSGSPKVEEPLLLLLPCRHLIACRTSEGALQKCPVCLSEIRGCTLVSFG